MINITCIIIRHNTIRLYSILLCKLVGDNWVVSKHLYDYVCINNVMEEARSSSIFYGCPLLGIKEGDYSTFAFNETEWAEALRSMPEDLLGVVLKDSAERS